MIDCSGCGASWTASSLYHCGACHRMFHSIVSFDHHRKTMRGPNGVCLDPANTTLRLRKRYGITAFGLTGEGDIVRTRRFTPVSPGN